MQIQLILIWVSADIGIIHSKRGIEIFHAADENDPCPPPLTPFEACARMKRNLMPGGQCRSEWLETEPTPFELIGGAATIDALVERFYAEMDALPAAQGVRALHGANLGPTKFVLKLYLGEWLGGPKLYSQSRGHPRLRMRHMPFPIGAAERDAWLACMARALDVCVADAPAREGIYKAMAGLADHMRNRRDAEA